MKADMDSIYTAQSVGVALSPASLFSFGYQVGKTNHISLSWISSTKLMLLFLKFLSSGTIHVVYLVAIHIMILSDTDSNNTNLSEAVVSKFSDC